MANWEGSRQAEASQCSYIDNIAIHPASKRKDVVTVMAVAAAALMALSIIQIKCMLIFEWMWWIWMDSILWYDWPNGQKRTTASAVVVWVSWTFLQLNLFNITVTVHETVTVTHTNFNYGLGWFCSIDFYVDFGKVLLFCALGWRCEIVS